MQCPKVIFRRDRGEYVLRWQDADRKWRQKATGLFGDSSRNHAEAVRLAAKLADELAQHVSSKTEWEQFVSDYSDHLTHLSRRYAGVWHSARASLELFQRPKTMAEVDDAFMSGWQSHLLASGKSKSTVRSYVKHMMASLRWAGRRMKTHVPRVELPRQGVKMRSRPVTAREVVLMIRQARELQHSQQLVDLIKGLWWSGLRLSEAVNLGWTWDWPITVDFNRQHPVFAFYQQKSGNEETVPMAPEFASFLKRRRHRQGPVFPLPTRNADNVGKALAEIGRRAKVVVSRGGKTATAHDLRRAFGTRWASRLMPAELTVLMRHKSIETTMGYYVDLRVDDITAKLYQSR